MVFMKYFFEKVILNKKQLTAKSMQKLPQNSCQSWTSESAHVLKNLFTRADHGDKYTYQFELCI